MNILSVGGMDGRSNTCLHRHWALIQNADKTDVINTSYPVDIWYKVVYHLFLYGFPFRLPDKKNANKQIIRKVSLRHYDVVWIDKGITIYPETLIYIKKVSPSTVIISYSPDNMALRHNQSQQYLQCIPLYDYIITNKSYILENMRNLGAKNILFVNNSYAETFHHPFELTDREKSNLGGDVGFIGAWEKERCASVLYLADHGVKVKVFGDAKWNKYINYNPNLQIMGHSLQGDDYSKSIQAFRISLCFLRKMNFDKQTTRSVEIPACGGFMLAERTDEHLNMFKENEEAVYFSSNEELLEKCQYYLAHDEERKAIADLGRKRCLTSGYSNEGMIRNVLRTIFDSTK